MNTEAITTEIKPSSTSNPTDDTPSPTTAPTETEGLIFKAVGIIRGEVNFSDESPKSKKSKVLSAPKKRS